MSRLALNKYLKLLEREKNALLAGDLETVLEIGQSKEVLAEKLEGADQDQLKLVQSKLSQNMKLLSAAQSGVGDAVAKLRQLQSSRTKLSSYDKSGNATEIRHASRSTDRRF